MSSSPGRPSSKAKLESAGKGAKTMPAISLVSADNLGEIAEEFALEPKRAPKPPRKALLPEASRAALDRAMRAFAVRMRRSQLYQFTLRGKIAESIAARPADLRPAQLEEADSYFRGRFRFAGQLIELREGSLFDRIPPSPSYAAALHGFEWLRHLEAVGNDYARDFASKLMQHWLKRYASYSLPSWQPEIIATRMTNLLAHGSFCLGIMDEGWRARLFRSLRDQTRLLARTI